MNGQNIINEIKQIQFAAELESDNAYQCFKGSDTLHGRSYYYGCYAAYELTKEWIRQLLEKLENELPEPDEQEKEPAQTTFCNGG